MREKRIQLFNSQRFGLESDSSHIQDTLTDIVRQEFQNLMTLDWKDDPSLTPNESDEFLFEEEEEVKLENDIIQEQGLLANSKLICYNFLVIYNGFD